MGRFALLIALPSALVPRILVSSPKNRLSGSRFRLTVALKKVYLRREQFRSGEVPSFCLEFARALVSGKIRDQRTMLQRNHVEPPPGPVAFLKCMQEDSEQASSIEQLLGIQRIKDFSAEFSKGA